MYLFCIVAILYSEREEESAGCDLKAAPSLTQ